MITDLGLELGSSGKFKASPAGSTSDWCVQNRTNLPVDLRLHFTHAGEYDLEIPGDPGQQLTPNLERATKQASMLITLCVNQRQPAFQTATIQVFKFSLKQIYKD